MDDAMDATIYYFFLGIVIFLSVVSHLLQMQGIAAIDSETLFNFMNNKLYEAFKGTLAKVFSFL